MLFRVHGDVNDERVTEALTRLRSLAVLPGIEQWRVELSLDARKGRILVEDGSFSDHAAFERFRQDARHIEVGRYMATISDWWNGDYVV
ncbi:MAG: Dabb family protein [Microbacterium sp.]|uniref:Dabb family protein n=1 Tax=Microbacterium sp. TaxID=51671 RepID=UPI002604D469|nr:Dabb family protein [Microbacterium sp.]MCX6501590.1 Dabb family protein [Microbacterium sp.]